MGVITGSVPVARGMLTDAFLANRLKDFFSTTTDLKGILQNRAGQVVVKIH